MRKNFIKAVAAVLLSLLAILCISVWKKYIYQTPQVKFVNAMGEGINIGNSLDSTGLLQYRPQANDLEYETFWGNPIITEELFKMIKEGGFSTVRIPVTWEEHMDDDGNVSEIWMDRVQEVVDMAMEQELYVIINTHHEEWLNLDTGREDEVVGRYRYLWEQIATRFKTYDNHLLFEGMNEPRLRDSEYEWTSGTKELQAMVNHLNQVFVETVRKTGEENKDRYLLICPYATNHVEEAMAALDVLKGNIIVSIHMYAPYSFCQDENGMTKWDTDDSICTEYVKEICKNFENMDKLFKAKGIPVILSEFGCTDKGNLSDRIEWIRLYKEQANEYGIPCIWWDNGSSYQIMNRERYTWVYPEIKEELIK